MPMTISTGSFKFFLISLDDSPYAGSSIQELKQDQIDVLAAQDKGLDSLQEVSYTFSTLLVPTTHYGGFAHSFSR